MPKAHFICRKTEQQGPGSPFPSFWCEDRHKQIYVTGWWKVTEDQAEALHQGRIRLHERKRDRSYMGGEILKVLIADPEGPDADRFAFVFRSTREDRQQDWDWGRNAVNQRAEQSIVLDD